MVTATERGGTPPLGRPASNLFGVKTCFWRTAVEVAGRFCDLFSGNKEIMSTEVYTGQEKLTREEMAELLNEDLAREYQAIIAYTIYSQKLKGAPYTDIAAELELHAAEELGHALKISKQIDYFGGMPVATPKQVKTSEDPRKMLEFDLENERVTIQNYRERIRQADAMGEFALSEVLRGIIVQEQEHLMDLADALGIEAPEID